MFVHPIVCFCGRQVTADDEDAGEHGHLSYSLEGEGVTDDSSSCFAVDPSSGAILLLRVSEWLSA